ncbi:FAD-dependent oxidoreductase [Terrarubrum flagellatum]|uniref:FAD-dependent oxidoreductase n=1 Tax=Terrirubrum flagellatum TaxID=2895980 RepID=UPI00314517C7
MRLAHPRLTPAAAVTFTFDGRPVSGLEGETIAAALSAAGDVALNRRADGTARGLWCGMGACFECIVTVDGRMSQRACMTRIAAGMEVLSQAPSPAEARALAEQRPAEEIACDVVIVGGGPAGLAAAAALGEAGLATLLIDERSDLGGQYLKPVAASHREIGEPLDAQFRESAIARREAEKAGAMIWSGATVWAAFAPDDLGVLHEGRQKIVRAKRLLLAPGAYERPMPIPGWTLPGVMTTGAAQTLARAYRVFPARRVVIAGNGPLNFQLAVELSRAGVEVAAIIEESRAPSLSSWRSAAEAMLASPQLLAKGAGYLLELRRHGVPVLWSSRVASVEGDDRARKVIVETPAGDKHFEVEAVALNSGFIPSTELARQLGCRHEYVDRHVGYLATATDENGRTSIDSVFAVGDGADVGGSVVAKQRAILAAQAILRDLTGREPDIGVTQRAKRNLDRALRFQNALWTLFAAPTFSSSAIDDATIICRCENLSAGTVRAALRSHGADAGTAKRLTRIGMGRCQGRNCASALSRLVEDAGGAPPQPLAFFAPRPPAKPTPLAALAAEKPEWGGHRQSTPPETFPHPHHDRPRWETRATDYLVIGGGVVGACVARELAQRGEQVLVVDRKSIGQEASTANAGSLHVQLLSFDFGAKAQADGLPAAETLRLGSPSIALWREIERQSGENLEIRVTGGLMVAETERDMAFLAQKAALESRYGVETHVIQSNELRALEPLLSDTLIGAAYCPAEGKINPLTASFAVVAQAKAAGAAFEPDAPVLAIERDGDGAFTVTTGAGVIRAKRIINCAGAWTPRISAMVAKPIPVWGAPLQMIATEPTAPMVSRLIAHADRHLSLKQTSIGSLLIGGGWSADLDVATGASRPLRWAVEGNAWVAARVLPAAAHLHIVRIWAGMNINIDGAPILGEMPGVPGFFNCVTSNGYTLAPLVARMTADLATRGRSDFDIAPFTLDRFQGASELPDLRR